MLTFGPYVVEGELGRGGVGVVYRARDGAGTRVAVKVLLPRGAQDPVQAGRLAREAKVLERLRHPAIVAVRATGELRGALWIAMDLLDGGSLEQRLARQGPLASRDAASLVLELTRAVAHAHAQGVLHRDLKPANVLLDAAGRPYLTDFGLAKDLGPGRGQSLSTTGQFLGTPAYWPPEQARGDRGAVGPWSDVFGLGALLYALLTGRAPIEVDSLMAAFAAVEQPPPRPSDIRPDLPRALEAICLRCLERRPEDRYASADDLARDLEGWLVVRRRPPRRSGPRALAVAAAVTVVVAAGAAVLVQQRSARTEPPPVETTSAPPVATTAAAPPSPRPPATTARATLVRAEALLNDGRAEEALATFEPLLAGAPGVAAQDLLDLGVAIGQAAFPEAEWSFLHREAAPADPDRARRALALLRGLVAQPEGDRLDARIALARTLHAFGDDPGAEATLAPVLADQPLIELEWALARGQLERAEALLKQPREPGDTLTDYLGAVVRVERAVAGGDLAAATNAYAALVPPGGGDPWIEQVTQHARARLLDALGVPPTDRPLEADVVDRLVTVGEELAAGGRHLDVLALLDALPAAARRQEEVLQIRGVIHRVLADRHRREGRPEDARAQLERVVETLAGATLPASLEVRATALMDLERRGEGLRTFVELVTTHPDTLPSVWPRAVTLARAACPELEGSFLGPSRTDPALARQTAAFLEALLPGAEEASFRSGLLTYAARALHVAGDAASTEALLRRASQEAPDDWVQAFARSEWLLWQGRLAEASDAHREALRCVPTGRAGPSAVLTILGLVIELQGSIAAGDQATARRSSDRLERLLRTAQDAWFLAVRDRVATLRARLDGGR